MNKKKVKRRYNLFIWIGWGMLLLLFLFFGIKITSLFKNGSEVIVKPSYYKPVVGERFQVQFDGVIDTEGVNASLYIVSLEGSDKKIVDQLKKSGKRVICSITSDLKTIIGDSKKLRESINKSLIECKEKGFDGIDPGPLDYYKINDFDLDFVKQIEFNRSIAAGAHDLGLAIALNNTPEMSNDLLSDFDFVIAYECFDRGDCDMYTPFIEMGKPVFDIEYKWGPNNFCKSAKNRGFDVIRKNLNMDGYLESC